MYLVYFTCNLYIYTCHMLNVWVPQVQTIPVTIHTCRRYISPVTSIDYFQCRGSNFEDQRQTQSNSKYSDVICENCQNPRCRNIWFQKRSVQFRQTTSEIFLQASNLERNSKNPCGFYIDTWQLCESGCASNLVIDKWIFQWSTLLTTTLSS